MAVAFQDDFETVQSLAEQMIYKEPTQPPEPVEDGELVESDNDGFSHKQYKSPLECGFKQTETKPAIFYKMLSDDDIRMREQTRKEKREWTTQEVAIAVKTDCPRPTINVPEHQRRRFHKNETEIKERRMREVILNELNEMWRTGHYLDRPDNVHPFIRGDSGEFSEESALRRRLFRGCFREFVNDCRRNARKRPHPGASYGPPPYGGGGGGGQHYPQQQQQQQRIHNDNHFRNRAEQQPHHHHGGYHRHGSERPRSVLDSVTWTTEEVRLYYECMAKYNVRPVLPMRHGRMLPMANTADNLPHQSQMGFSAPVDHPRRRHYEGMGSYGARGGDRRGRGRSSLEPDNSPSRLPSLATTLLSYHSKSISPQVECHSTLPLSPTPTTTSSHKPQSHPQHETDHEDVPKIPIDTSIEDNKIVTHSPAERLPREDLSPDSPANASTSPVLKDSVTIFVDELLSENADSELVHLANGETGEIDLYDDL